jgi:hypothetical protein
VRTTYDFLIASYVNGASNISETRALLLVAQCNVTTAVFAMLQQFAIGENS